jgi:hypothetical protein
MPTRLSTRVKSWTSSDGAVQDWMQALDRPYRQFYRQEKFCGERSPD